MCLFVPNPHLRALLCFSKKVSGASWRWSARPYNARLLPNLSSSTRLHGRPESMAGSKAPSSSVLKGTISPGGPPSSRSDAPAGATWKGKQGLVLLFQGPTMSFL